MEAAGLNTFMPYPTTEALCTLAQAKAVLALNDTLEDAALNFYIGAASAHITQSCNRTFWLTSNAANPLVEFYSGSGTEWLVLRQWPVASIASVYEDDLAYWGAASGSFASTSLLTAGTDYALALDDVARSGSGRLCRMNGVWNCRYVRDAGMLSSYPDDGFGNVKVSYTVGYDSIPQDLSFACCLVVAKMRQMFPAGQPVSSESFEEYSVAYRALLKDSGLGLLGGEVGAVLAKYRILPVGHWA